MTIDDSNNLNNARDAISRGDKQTAQRILTDILNKDNRNADAWLLLSDILDNSEQRIESLKHVLQSNPNNFIAERRLHELIEASSKSKNPGQPTLSKPIDAPAIIHPKKNNALLIILAALFLVVCGCVAIAYFAGTMGGSVKPPTSLPPHIVNDLWISADGGMVDYYIVVDKAFTKDNAMRLITYYQAQHSGYAILNVIFYCDKTYAQEKYLQPKPLVPDSELYKHMLYWYQTGRLSWSGTHFVVNITNPDFTDYPTLGSSCK